MEENRVKMFVFDIRDETHNVKTFRFVPKNSEKVNFKAGQFVFLYANIKNEIIKRAYSIASSPTVNEYIELTMEKVPQGKMSTFFFESVKKGDVFEVGSPMGHFFYTEEMSKNIVLIAGGSGVVPLMCISRYCNEMGLSTKITLIYSARTNDDIIYKKELEEMKRKNQKFNAVYTLTRENGSWSGNIGRINKELLIKNASNISDSLYYLCGPLDMIRSVAEILRELGIERQRIKRDVWG